MASPKEASARLKINKLLEQAGWRFFDNEKGQANIQLEPNVKISQKDIDAFGNNFESTKNGFIDFLLLDDKGFQFVILEAKGARWGDKSKSAIICSTNTQNADTVCEIIKS